MSAPETAVTFATATYKTAGGRTRSADTRTARALRGLQVLDKMQGRGARRAWYERTLMLRAMDALGAQLSIRCTGVGNPEEGYDHNGDTCPVHEWLIEADYQQCEIPGDVPADAEVRGAR